MSTRIVVVGADLGKTGDEAIRVGLEQLAEGAAQGMYVVHALATDPAPRPSQKRKPDLDGRTVRKVSESLMLRIGAIAEREHLPYYEGLVRVEVRKGQVQQTLLDAAHEHHAELIIVGTHGRRGLDRLLAGSIAETLVQRATCSVLVARVQPESPGDKPWEAVAHRTTSTHRFDPARGAVRVEALTDRACEDDWRPSDQAPAPRAP